MQSKAQIRWNLYRQSSSGRIDYHNVSTLTPNTIVYGFRIKVSTITRCSLVDSSKLFNTNQVVLVFFVRRKMEPSLRILAVLLTIVCLLIKQKQRELKRK